MRKHILIFILVFIGIFIEIPFIGTIGNVVLNFLILFVIGYVLYTMYRESHLENAYDAHYPDAFEEDDSAEMQPSLNSVIDNIEPGYLKSLLQANPSYSEFLITQFDVIWNYLLPNNGLILYSSSEKTAAILFKRFKNPEIFRQVHGRAQLLDLIDNRDDGFFLENSLEVGNNILPYYDDSYQPRAVLSFITRFDNNQQLYWIFDSNVPNHFNQDDLKIIRQVQDTIQKIISTALNQIGLESSYADLLMKYELAVNLNEADSLTDCIDRYADFIVTQFEASKLTIATREINKENDNVSLARIQKAIGGDDPFKRGTIFVLTEGLNGTVISKNKPLLLSDIENGEEFIPRFSEKEKSNYELRSFLSVPISMEGGAIGMTTLEDKKPNKYNKETKQRLIEFNTVFSSAVSRFINELDLNNQ